SAVRMITGARVFVSPESGSSFWDFDELEETDTSYMLEGLLDKPKDGEIRREIKELVEEAKVEIS
ncbi:MAG: hypothetical protein ACK4SM_06835, partial [Aquificaceae bacterium]